MVVRSVVGHMNRIVIFFKKKNWKKEKYKGKNGPKAKKDQENCRIKKKIVLNKMRRRKKN